LNLEYDNIVVGSTLEALLYAYKNDYPVFFTEARRPFRFDYLEAEIDLSFLKIPPEDRKLTTFGETKNVGIRKEIVWERILFLLSLSGRAPLSDLCSGMRYDGEKIICTNEYSKIAEVKFNTCFYFDEPNISGLIKKQNIENPTYLCYDYIGFHKGGKHEIDYITTSEDFVSEIWFYSSDRICGNTGVKDACVLSRLTKKQIDDFSCSETMSRFKALSIMYENGMKGQLNGYTNRGTPRYYKFKASSIGREKRLLRSPTWTSQFNVKRIECNTAEMLQEISLHSHRYIS
jgi:hypothetical protein